MKLLKATLMASALLAGNVLADPITIDLDGTGGVIGPADYLTVNYDSFTAINLNTGTVSTTAGYDAIASGNYTDFLDMTTEGLAYTNILGSNPDNSFAEYLTSGSFLTFGVNLVGTFDATNGITYTGGTISLYSGDYDSLYTDFATTNPQQLLVADFVSGGYTVANQDVTANVSTITAAGQDTFFADISGSLMSFEDYLGLNTSNMISFLIEQNVQGGALQLLADVQAEVDAGNVVNGVVNVSAQHNASIITSVPEPTSLAILALGLLGFAGVRRARS